MKSGLLIVVAATAMSGCAGPMVFENAGSTNTLEQDQYDCQIIVKSGPYAMAYARDPLSNMAYPAMARGEMRRCLERKGWKLQEGAR